MATILPRRGTRTNAVVTITNCASYALINYGEEGMYIRNNSDDDDADSTYVPGGGSFSSPDNLAYYQNGLTRVIFDGPATSFSFEAMGDTPVTT